MKAITIDFPGGRTARLLRVGQRTPARAIIEALQLPLPKGVLCLNGGTEELAGQVKEQLRKLLADGLARMAGAEGLTVITGGTEAGIFALFGCGVAAWGTSAPVIGIAPRKPLVWPGCGKGDTPLEPHHSHFVIVEGENGVTRLQPCMPWRQNGKRTAPALPSLPAAVRSPSARCARMCRRTGP